MLTSNAVRKIHDNFESVSNTIPRVAMLYYVATLDNINSLLLQLCRYVAVCVHVASYIANV